MTINSRDKGARGERSFSEWLRDHGVAARRGVQYAGGPNSPDVLAALPGFHFEVKRTERLQLEKAMAQARKDAPKGDIPVVAYRRNRGEWLVTMRAEDVLSMMRAYGEVRSVSKSVMRRKDADVTNSGEF